MPKAIHLPRELFEIGDSRYIHHKNHHSFDADANKQRSENEVRDHRCVVEFGDTR
jgi:hypothetical protein